MISMLLLLVPFISVTAALLIVLAVDKHPQYLTWVLTESAPDTYTELRIPLPLGLVGGAQQNMAIEITKVVWDNDRPNRVAEVDTRFDSHLSVRPKTAAGNMGDGDIIDKQQVEIQSTGAVAGFDFETNAFRPVYHDLSDGDGNAPIYAAQTLFVGVEGSGGNTAARTSRGRAYYRMVRVSAQELLGLAAQLTSGS